MPLSYQKGPFKMSSTCAQTHHSQIFVEMAKKSCFSFDLQTTPQSISILVKLGKI